MYPLTWSVLTWSTKRAHLEHEGDLVFNEGLRAVEDGFIGGAELLADGGESPLALVEADGQTDEVPQIARFDDGLKAGQTDLSVLDPRDLFVAGG